jgi:hypothetical protein
LKNIFRNFNNKQVKYRDIGITRESLEEELIEFYDSEGQKIYIDREEFRKNVLPHNIQKSWNDPQALFNLIYGNVDDYPDELEEAAKRQLEIDYDPERSHAIVSIVFIKSKRLLDARKILKNYIKKYGPTAAILTNLAKTYENSTKS